MHESSAYPQILSISMSATGMTPLNRPVVKRTSAIARRLSQSSKLKKPEPMIASPHKITPLLLLRDRARLIHRRQLSAWPKYPEPERIAV